MSNKEHLDDYLALERTDLAIDRTLLAYIRTSLTIVVVGASSIKLFGSVIASVFGWTMIAIAVVIIVFGFKRCLGLRKKNNGKDVV